ncbi:MAG: hypothetical protein WA160_00975 [Pseudobdellovibrio sp.]
MKILITLIGFIALSSLSAQAKNKFFTANALLVPKLSVTPTASTKLLYYGGPVISHVKVVPIFWSSRVKPNIQGAMDDFYTSYVNSKHMDWLSEYATNVTALDGRQGTNQVIGRGQSIASILIQPVLTKKQISDVEVQNELVAQIDAGHLPKPDSDTLFMIHFPSDIQIVIEGMTSCFSFGGYHNGAKNEKYGDLFYAVLPDCAFSTMDAEATLSSATFVAAHELIEAVTDAYPTPGDKPAFPQAWNAADGNEIADLCSTGGSTLVGANATYKISLEWSNSRNTCYDGQ